MNFEIIIGVVALVFSIVCFSFFVLDAWRRARAEAIANRAQQAAREAAADVQESFDPAILAAMAKALADAFTKAGPGVLALIGSILFLLLAGEATNVYNLTGSAAQDGPDTTANVGDTGTGDPGNTSNQAGDDNQVDAGDDSVAETANQV